MRIIYYIQPLFHQFFYNIDKTSFTDWMVCHYFSIIYDAKGSKGTGAVLSLLVIVPFQLNLDHS